MKVDTVPDLSMRGQADPRARSGPRRPPTLGQLAARLEALAARPAAWWPLVRPETAQRVPLDGSGAGIWLATWPPGHHADLDGARITVVLAGEPAELCITADGVTERPLRANRVHVHGAARSRRLLNPGPGYAVTLHT